MVMPPSNLPPAAQPWARDVEKQLAQNATLLSSLSDNVDAAFKGVNSGLGKLGEQISAIAAQQAALTEVVNDLADAVADIASISAQQVAGSTGTNGGSATVNPTPTDYASVTFTVPAGYTKANVLGVSAYTGGGTVASVVSTRIAGANSTDTYAFNNAAYASTSSSFARSLTGLTPGSTFSVSTVVYTTGSPTTTSAVIQTSASVIWLK